ncbi:MAG: hypothetical protein Q7T53_13820 [Deltaproteobacteria bacterium]|nr:hypothetical protein [Deltaproteobacteria bacterium]
MKKNLMLFCLLTLITIGCGENVFEGQEDKGTSEAERLEISNKLDSGDYPAVLNDPNATAVEYGEAAMGLAGLDPVSLIQAMNDVAEDPNITDNDLGPVTNLPINPDALDELQAAKNKLSSEISSICTADPTSQQCKDLNFQMTILSLSSTITAFAQVGQTNVGGFDPTDGISTTEATSLGNYIASNPTVQADANGDGTPDTGLATLIDGDVDNVVAALPNAALGADSDLNQVLTEATQGSGSINYDGTGDVTSTDISNYLKNVLGI